MCTYVESYSRTNIRYRSDTTDRYETYAPFLEAEDGPIILARLPKPDDLFFEPIYQAVRHILMAHEITRYHDEIDEAVVLHARSHRNRALLANPSRGLSASSNVYDAIRAIMRRPETLIDVEHEMLLGSVRHVREEAEYPLRYLRDRYAT